MASVEFETEYKTVPLAVVPLAFVVGQSYTAVITLGNGRELRGRIDRDDALILHDVDMILNEFMKATDVGDAGQQ